MPKNGPPTIFQLASKTLILLAAVLAVALPVTAAHPARPNILYIIIVTVSTRHLPSSDQFFGILDAFMERVKGAHEGLLVESFAVDHAVHGDVDRLLCLRNRDADAVHGTELPDLADACLDSGGLGLWDRQQVANPEPGVLPSLEMYPISSLPRLMS